MEVSKLQPGVAQTPAVQAKKRNVWWRRNRETVVAYSFLTPMIIYFAITTFVPMAFLIVMSFAKWNLISPPTWAGLENFKTIFSSANNWFYMRVILRTLVYGIVILTLNVVVGFGVALVLNQPLKGKGLFRTMWYLPGVFSGAVIALLLKIYLQPSSYGLLNVMIGRFGFAPVDWINHPFWMPVITVLFTVWQGIGGTVIFFLAGLQSVDENLYDAAKIDGANEGQLLWYITIPQMVPVLLFITVTGLIGSMQMWEVPRLITGGGPNELTYTLVWSIQNDAFGALRVGLGTAESLVLFVMLLGFIGWQLQQYRKQYDI